MYMSEMGIGDKRLSHNYFQNTMHLVLENYLVSKTVRPPTTANLSQFE